MIYAIGGYGCGNLGDDAIFQGLLKEHPEVVQIYVNMSSYKNNIWYGTIKEEGFPEVATGGELILGGGGLLHSKRTVGDFLSVCEKAKLRDMGISIRKVGAEYLTDEFVPEARELCSLANYISVRSRKSKEILEGIGIQNVVVDKDYTYNLTMEDACLEESDLPIFEVKHQPTIGLITAGNQDDLDKIAKIIKFLITDHGFGNTTCNVLHIPHSRHYTDHFTNDVVTGEILCSMVDIYHDRRYDKFILMPFPGSCLELLNVYTHVDAIIGLRYHSFIFSELASKPLLGLVAGEKAKSYFENKRENCYSIDIGKPIVEILEAVFNFVVKIKGLEEHDFYAFKTKSGDSRVDYLLKEVG